MSPKDERFQPVDLCQEKIQRTTEKEMIVLYFWEYRYLCNPN